METTKFNKIKVDPSKIKGEKTFMSVWDALKEENQKIGKKAGKREIVLKLLNKFSTKQVSELLDMSEKEIEEIVKSGK